jgi:hypothetical protein
MQGQLGEMQSEQRAWVSETKDFGIERLFVNDANELRGAIRIVLQNSGKNPAVAVFVNAEMSLGTAMPHGSMPAWQKGMASRFGSARTPMTGKRLISLLSQATTFLHSMCRVNGVATA